MIPQQNPPSHPSLYLPPILPPPPSIPPLGRWWIRERCGASGQNSLPHPSRIPCQVVMLSSIACAVDLSQSLPSRPIDVAKLEGVSGSIRNVSELGIAETVQAEELDYLHGECCLAPGKIGRYDRRGLRFWWNLDRYYRRLLGFWWNLGRY